jgi:hypothetical protein
MIYPNSQWMVDQIKEKYGKSERYPLGEEDALNIGIWCNKFVIIYVHTLFTLQ